jgi:hypothetical protein
MHKKMKYHKKPPVITITKDDVELVAEKVQDMGKESRCHLCSQGAEGGYHR